MTRAYDSPVRREQRQVTRERILEAFAAELAGGGDDFAIRRVAARAGVSERTVYQHFPNREAQIEAVAEWIDEQVGGVGALPATAADLPAFARACCERFFAHERLLRAQLTAGIAGEVRKRRRRKLEAAIEAALATTGASRAELELAGASVKAIISAQFGVRLLDGERLEPAQAARAIEWLVRLVVGGLLRGPRP